MIDETDTGSKIPANEDKLEITSDASQEEGNTEADPQPKKKTWFEKRIDRAVAANGALQRTNEVLMEEIANLKAGKAEDGTKTDLTRPEIDKLIDAKAEELATQKAATKSFDSKCNAVFEAGIDEFDDFTESVDVLKRMGVMTNSFLEMTTDLDEPQKILHHLGKNPEEADRIQNLPLAKQAAALAKLELSLTKPESKPISKTPPPVKTINTKTSKADFDPDAPDINMEDWIKWREKNARKSRL